METIGKSIKDFFKTHTKTCNEQLVQRGSDPVESIDNCYIFCPTPDNFIYTVKTILAFLKPLNPQSSPADDSDFLHLGELIYYVKDDK